MTLRTVTYDDSKFKIVPIEPTNGMKNRGIAVEVYQDSKPDVECLTWSEARAIYKAMVSAAPEYQEPTKD